MDIVKTMVACSAAFLALVLIGYLLVIYYAHVKSVGYKKAFSEVLVTLIWIAVAILIVGLVFIMPSILYPIVIIGFLLWAYSD